CRPPNRSQLSLDEQLSRFVEQFPAELVTVKRFLERAFVATKEGIWRSFVWIERIDVGKGDQITFGERSQLCPFFCTEKSSGRISKCDTCGHSGLLRSSH